jgi:hypothetical protein
VSEQSEPASSQSSTDGNATEPTAEQQTVGWVPQPTTGESPAQETAASAAAASAGAASAAADRPELLVAGAFAGGVLAALILKRLAR